MELMGLPISTSRLQLRCFCEADVDAFAAYRNDPEIARYQSWDGITRESALVFIRSQDYAGLGIPGGWQQIAIASRPGNELIGDIGLFLRAHRRSAELGFTLSRGQQGRGLAREAVEALIDALFARTSLEKLEAVTDTRNLPSIALLRKLEFELITTAAAFFKGAPCEEHTFERTREAWTRRRRELCESGG
jgi:RimJ/RimL family protein N-acetyltransferase